MRVVIFVSLIAGGFVILSARLARQRRAAVRSACAGRRLPPQTTAHSTVWHNVGPQHRGETE